MLSTISTLFSQASFICNDELIIKLSKICSNKITCELDITKALNETQEWTMEFGEAVYNVISAYDFDKDLDGSEAKDEDNNTEEECALEADSNEGLTGKDIEGSDSDEEEKVVPRKRARMANAPSCVPVLVATRARKYYYYYQFQLIVPLIRFHCFSRPVTFHKKTIIALEICF